MILPASLNSALISSVQEGSGLNNQQSMMLRELWQFKGLDKASPLTITDNLLQSGGKEVSINNDSQSATVLTRVI